ncbi:hypothetical protein [Terasakiella sp. SH-1]|uniref:hypothetical protein n=1 Tax=Terasakiella sp. SH-1 TaxID=2560057 RepID=UPI001073B94E|nr:hypothetical protein [Terasakiella sp. SH-1]
MRIKHLLCIILLAGCSLHSQQPVPYQGIPETYWSDFADKSRIQAALEQQTSEETHVLLARIYLKDNYDNRAKILPLITPYVTHNADAAMMYGLVYYSNNDEEAFYGFLHAARQGHPTGMLYLASHYHHILNRNRTAVYWAFKAVEKGCGIARNYHWILDMESEDKQELNDTLYPYMAEFDNMFSQIVMMGKANSTQQPHEHAYWKRRIQVSQEKERQAASGYFYDLHKECRERFSQDLYDRFSSYGQNDLRVKR